MKKEISMKYSMGRKPADRCRKCSSRKRKRSCFNFNRPLDGDALARGEDCYVPKCKGDMDTTTKPE